MSGISSKLNNDQCYVDSYTDVSVKAINYAQFLPFYVNPNSDANLQQCTLTEGVSNCSACTANQGSTIQVSPDGFSKRIDVENCLKNLGKPLDSCSFVKNASCDMEVAFNPALCERDITPTNIPKFQ
jgi:hypothetical protein